VRARRAQAGQILSGLIAEATFAVGEVEEITRHRNVPSVKVVSRSAAR